MKKKIKKYDLKKIYFLPFLRFCVSFLAVCNAELIIFCVCFPFDLFCLVGLFPVLVVSLVFCGTI